jgi:hypothetical protein
MIKLIVGLVAAGIVVTVLYYTIIIWFVGGAIDAVNSEAEVYKEYIGKKYLYEGDTVLVIDYSLFNDTYTLSNGVKVNSALIIPK